MTLPWRFPEDREAERASFRTAPTLCYAIEEASQVGEVRRAAESLGARAGMSDSEIGTLALVVTELATNLARHANGGRILLTPRRDFVRGVDALAIDDGPGIADVGRAMADGFSSAGTPGKGLGAIRRMASDFSFHTRRGQGEGAGTVMLARVQTRTSSLVSEARNAAGVVCVPYPGEVVSGDAWCIAEVSPLVTMVAVADGLGHGELAAEAAAVAMRVVEENARRDPVEILGLAHSAMRATRGAALAIAKVDVATGKLTFAGIGNISASIQLPDGTSRGLSSSNGTVGHTMRKVQAFEYDWSANAALVMHSDGINTHWRMGTYAGIAASDPAILAAALYRDARRGRDDATVVVFRTQKA